MLTLRESIAAEAARLVVRGSEVDFAAARKRAARRLSRQRVATDDLPSDAEIQQRFYEFTGLFPDGQNSAAHDTPDADVFAALRMLLVRLEQVRLNPELHPEGDALYHSLQVYDLGRGECPYDEEFLLACLLHDAGLAIDPRNPVPALFRTVGNLLTQRTRLLIEHRIEALQYLASGRMARSLRRSEHFDDLLLLARCDLDGRVAGAEVSTLDEALVYITGVSTIWDEV